MSRLIWGCLHGLFALHGEGAGSFCLDAECRACVAAVCTSRSGRQWHCLRKRPSASRTRLAGLSPRPFSLREEIENGERHRGLIDPAPNDPAICEEGGKRAREREGGTRGSNKYLGD